MANKIYPKFKKRCATSGGNLVAGVVKAQLLDLAEYTYSDSHEFFSDIPAAARVGPEVTLTNKTVSDLGVFDADDLVLSGLVGIPSTEALVLRVDNGNEATSPLFFYVDTAPGLPIAAGSIGGTVVWPNGASKIVAF